MGGEPEASDPSQYSAMTLKLTAARPSGALTPNPSPSGRGEPLREQLQVLSLLPGLTRPVASGGFPSPGGRGARGEGLRRRTEGSGHCGVLRADARSVSGLRKERPARTLGPAHALLDESQRPARPAAPQRPELPA